MLNETEVNFLRDAAGWSDFYASLRDQFMRKGSLSERQVAAVQSGMVKIAARKAAKPVAEVNISAIEALFAKATDNAVKKPIFRTLGVTLSLAPATGRNGGALYVKGTESGTYLGKIVEGKFHGTRDANDETVEQLRLVAENPEGEVIKYASKFSACSCCGRTLKNPVSVLSVVGPICAGNWGLEHLREQAAEELKRLKAEEAAQAAA